MKLSQITLSVTVASVASFAILEAPAQAASFKIMPLGDSITRGFPKADDVEGYRGELFSLLNDHEDYKDVEIDFVGRLTNGSSEMDKDHEGWAGFTIDELTNVPEIKETTPEYKKDAYPLYQSISEALKENSPDLVLLMAGTNDLLVGDSAAKAAGELGTLIDSIKNEASVIVSSIVPFDTTGPIVSEAEADRSREFNALLPSLVAGKGENVFFADAGAQVSSLYEDGFHPALSGYETLAQGWFDGIVESKVIDEFIAANQPVVDDPVVVDNPTVEDQTEDVTDGNTGEKTEEDGEQTTGDTGSVGGEVPPVGTDGPNPGSDVTVPEPTSLIGLLAFGVLGAGATRKRKQKLSQESASA
ncbi:MAG: GDSL-type esterase/lipase family protein [Cyanophyceae cyanobacterium]